MMSSSHHLLGRIRKCGGAFHCLVLTDLVSLTEVPKIKKNEPELKKTGNEHTHTNILKYVLRKR